MFLLFGGEQAPLDQHQWKFTRILLAKHFPGWTLEYIDNLSQQNVTEIFAVLRAQDEARNDQKKT